MNPRATFTTDVVLDLVKHGVQQNISRQGLERVVNVNAYIDHITGNVILRLTRNVASENLPPQAFTVTVTTPHYVTAWDHWKAARWERRWMWYLRDLGWISPPRTADRDTRATVDVRTAWQYPDTPVLRPGLGTPVVYTNTEQRRQ